MSNELNPQDENYCMYIADRGMKKKEAYKVATGNNHKNERGFDTAVYRFHNRPKIINRIKELQKETREIRNESIRETIKSIDYDKKKAYDDLKLLHGRSVAKGNIKEAINAINSIIKLLGLAEETSDDEKNKFVFEFLHYNKKNDPENNKTPT